MSLTKFISVSSSKGGVGKSTLTTIFATGLLSHFHLKVAVVDIDPQESIVKIRQLELKEIERNPPKPNSSYYKHLIKNKEETGMHYPDIFKINLYEDYTIIRKRLEKLNGKYDVVFLDFPGSLNIHINTILLLKELDYIFIPYYADQNNSNSTFSFLSALKELKGQNKIKANYYLFFNRYDGVNGKNGFSFESSREKFKKMNLPVLKNVIYDMVDIERYSTIVPLRPGNGIKNTYHLIEEIYTIIKNN